MLWPSVLIEATAASATLPATSTFRTMRSSVDAAGERQRPGNRHGHENGGGTHGGDRMPGGRDDP